VLRTPGYKKTEAAVRARAIELLKVFSLENRLDDKAGSLPYGEQRKLEIVRALATKPKLILLDEPAAGMNPQETATLMRLIHRVRDEFKVTVLLIEHDMSLVMKICERIYVLDYGKEIARGTPGEIQSNKQVIKAYLGEA
jgi:branched-chain amino acid transport system ATP-binding protein